MNLRAEDLQALFRLWGEIAEFPVGEADQALRHCLAELARLIGAANAVWIGADRNPAHPTTDAMRGWRARNVLHLHTDDLRNRLTAELMRQQRNSIVDPQTDAMIDRAGATRAHLRPELVADMTWRRSWIYNEVLRRSGVEDRLLGTHALHGTAESHVALDRSLGDKPFGARERNLLKLFLGGSPLFHREVMMARGVTHPPGTLSPRERAVLRLLLTDMSEREIAQALGLTWRSTHQYVVAVLRKFQVKGRIGLMALWLRHRDDPQSPPAPPGRERG